MDTNLLSVLVTALLTDKVAVSSPAVAGAGNLNGLLIAGMILLAAVAPTLVSVVTYFQAKATKLIGDEIKKTSSEAATSLEKVHIAVNSERKEMTDLVAKLRSDVLELSKDKATMTGEIIGKELSTKPILVVGMTVEQLDLLAVEIKKRMV